MFIQYVTKLVLLELNITKQAKDAARRLHELFVGDLFFFILGVRSYRRSSDVLAIHILSDVCFLLFSWLPFVRLVVWCILNWGWLKPEINFPLSKKSPESRDFEIKSTPFKSPRGNLHHCKSIGGNLHFFLYSINIGLFLKLELEWCRHAAQTPESILWEKVAYRSAHLILLTPLGESIQIFCLLTPN